VSYAEKFEVFNPETKVLLILSEMTSKKPVKKEELIDEIEEWLEDDYSSNTRTMIKYHLEKLAKEKYIEFFWKDNEEFVKRLKPLPGITDGFTIRTFSTSRRTFMLLVISFILFLTALLIAEPLLLLYCSIFLISAFYCYIGYHTLVIFKKRKE